MTYVKLGSVRAFPGARPDKAQALKPLEEAAEVFGAWQMWELSRRGIARGDTVREGLLDEIADAVQALCNLAAALGVDDLTPHIAQCEERNRERGRYGE